MKKYILLFLVCLYYPVSLQAQCTVAGNVTFHSQAEIDFFHLQHPGCNEITGNLRIEENTIFSVTNLSGLSQLERIGGDLIIQNNSELVSLAGLDQVNFIGGRLSILNNPELISIAGLHGLVSIEEDFRLINNESIINFSGIENLEEIGHYFTIEKNHGLKNLSGLDKLHSIGGNFLIKENNSLINLEGIETLALIQGRLYILENPSLVNLNGFGYINYAELQQLHINDNVNLGICDEPFICAYIHFDGNTNIHDNAFGCDSRNEIIQSCASLSILSAMVYYDINQNQIKDPEERAHLDLHMKINPLDLYLFPNSYNGESVIFLEGGNYNLAYQQMASPMWELTTSPASIDIEISDLIESEHQVFFGVYPTVSHSEMITSIVAPSARCNQFITFTVSTKNIGTTITKGTLWLEVDPDIVAGTYIDIPDVSEPNRYGWHYEELYPGQTITKEIKLKIPDASFTGAFLNFISYTTFNDVNGDHTSRYFEYNTEVRCSYDPNDKLVHPKRPGDYTLFDEDLIYTIRFQNTGNDVAYDVVIRDTLDPNLEVNSFRFISSSHEQVLNTTITDERYLTFEFNNIYLPDSTSNFDESQGYVDFFISPKEGLEEETLITNSAGIYFDENPPILTNDTKSLMVSMLPTTSINHSLKTNLSIFPNPTNGTVTFDIDGNQTGHLQVVNVIGEVVLEKEIIDDAEVVLNAFANGVYFFKVEIEGEMWIEKVIKY